MTTQTHTPEPKIYVACLASYNSGTLHGKWIDAAQDEEDIRAEIKEMLSQSLEPMAEEYAIHDYSDFAGIKLDEYTDIENVSEFAKAIKEHDNPYVLAQLYNHLGIDDDIHKAIEYYEDNYRGEYDSYADFAQQLYEECEGEVPRSLEYYINWDQMGRDHEINGDVFVIEFDHGYHFFWNC